MPTVDRRLREGAHHERLRAARGRARGRPAALLPRAGVGRPAPVVEMEGAERIMLGSNNYLGLTDDPRVMQGARDALEQLRHRPDRLAACSTARSTCTSSSRREIADWMGTEEAIVFTTGHQANLGALGTLLGPGDTVIADSGDHASILDGCLLSRAKLRPFRHNRLDKLEKQLQRARPRTAAACSSSSTASSRWRATSPRSRDRRARPALRRPPDGRRGARRRRARRARRRRVASCSASRTASTCAWAPSRSRSPPAAASSPARTRSSTSCASSRAPSCSPPRRARRRRRRARRAARRPLRRGPAAAARACSTTPATCATACTTSASGRRPRPTATS